MKTGERKYTSQLCGSKLSSLHVLSYILSVGCLLSSSSSRRRRHRTISHRQHPQISTPPPHCTVHRSQSTGGPARVTARRERTVPAGRNRTAGSGRRQRRRRRRRRGGAAAACPGRAGCARGARCHRWCTCLAVRQGFRGFRGSGVCAAMPESGSVAEMQRMCCHRLRVCCDVGKRQQGNTEHVLPQAPCVLRCRRVAAWRKYRV